MSTLSTNFFAKINHLSPLEHNFTEVLNTIALTPKILYSCGKIPENVSETKSEITPNSSLGRRPKTVAIVGSRHSTKYGEEVAYKLAYELAKQGVVIVSGLAYGIDSIGHRGCLDAGGVTVAVLGSPINKIQPTAHTSLAKEIIDSGGAIISEYAPTDELQAPLAPGEAGWDGTKWVAYDSQTAHSKFIKRKISYTQSFLYRNRLISGLSDAVVVVEAAERSGSLNTAAQALEQGKEVFAVPGNITNPYSQGCNKLIRQGAAPYTEPRDITNFLFPEESVQNHRRARRQKLLGDNDVETKILQSIAEGCRSGEEIMRESHLPPEVFNEAITMLEIKSRLRSLGANNWALV